jgi:heat-inducible transcriptional repressor
VTNVLTERQQLILRAVVDDYICSAEPVGSRTISKHKDVGLSPATIRNEMSDLEGMGYLEQPHTSAGRIPSQKGYRFYVDYLMEPAKLSKQQVMQIRRLFMNKLMEMEQVVQQTASILSSLTNYTAVVLGPQVFETTLRHVEIVPLNDNMAVAIVVTDTGHVEHKTVSIPGEVPVDEIRKLVNLLNAKMTGVPLFRVKQHLYQEISKELQRHIEQYEHVMKLLDAILEPDMDGKVYLGGTTNMLNQPEFRDVEKLKPLLSILEQNQRVVQLFGTLDTQGVQVRIGQENPFEQVHNCSLVTATYSFEGKPIGSIGVLGPTRMDYARVIGVLEYLSKALSHLFTQMYR